MFDVSVQNKPLQTPQGNPVRVQTIALKRAIEEEWRKDPSPDYQHKPLTSLVATALDRVVEEQEIYIMNILQSVSNDVILFWANSPESLKKLQEQKWAPLIEEINSLLDITLKPTISLKITPLTKETEKKIKEFLHAFNAFELTGFQHLITLLSSFCIAFLVLQERLIPDEAWDLAHLHEQEQRRVWGDDEGTVQQEKHQREEFFETVRFLKLLSENLSKKTTN